MPRPSDEQERELARGAWEAYLLGGLEMTVAPWRIRAMGLLPSDPRCKMCRAPFRGPGRPLVRFLGYPPATPSTMNPALCDHCEITARKHEVGVELELTLLFADVRGSTQLAERIGPSEFRALIDRFYRASTEVLVRTDGLVDKLVGDEVIALYVPGLAGERHAQRALDAARELLAVTGHSGDEEPWLSIGAGIHTGTGWVGAVGSSDALNQVTVLGDVANTTARLASAAGPGEILVSAEACERGGLDVAGSETRTLELKGKSQPVTVHVLHAAPSVSHV